MAGKYIYQLSVERHQVQQYRSVVVDREGILRSFL